MRINSRTAQTASWGITGKRRSWAYLSQRCVFLICQCPSPYTHGVVTWLHSASRSICYLIQMPLQGQSTLLASRQLVSQSPAPRRRRYTEPLVTIPGPFPPPGPVLGNEKWRRNANNESAESQNTVTPTILQGAVQTRRKQRERKCGHAPRKL